MSAAKPLVVAFFLAWTAAEAAAPPACFEVTPPDESYGSKIRELVETEEGQACLGRHPVAARMHAAMKQTNGDWRARSATAVNTGLAELESRPDLGSYDAIREQALAGDRFDNPDGWKFGTGQVADSAYIDFFQACGGQSANYMECRERAAPTWAAMAFVHYMHKLAVEAGKSGRQDYIARSDKRLARWERYLDAQSFQYPWELTANYCLHTHAVEGWLKHAGCFVPGLNGVIARNAMEAQPPTGWRDVPTSRLILLHPEIGISYANNASDGEQVEPSLVFEWVGVMGWSWNNDWAAADDDVFDCPLNLCPVGIALTSVYADRADVDDLGHGVTLHFRNFALSATRHDEAVGGTTWMLTLSANLSELFGNNRGNIRDAFQDLVTRED